ncbi:MAG: hypothetical protein AB7S38_29115 [Vulcanimicrobiota bacterium]
MKKFYVWGNESSRSELVREGVATAEALAQPEAQSHEWIVEVEAEEDDLDAETRNDAGTIGWREVISVEAFEARLEEVSTVAELQKWSEELYASDLLDESEQTNQWGPRGPMAPWEHPSDAELVWDNGEDVIVLLSSGELARWRNDERAWSEAQPTEEFDAVLVGEPVGPDMLAKVEVFGSYAIAWAYGQEDGPYWTGSVDELPLVEYPVTSDLFGVPSAEVEGNLDKFVEAIQETIPGLRFTALHNVGGAIRRSPEASDFLETAANVAAWERASEVAFGELADQNF